MVERLQPATAAMTPVLLTYLLALGFGAACMLLGFYLVVRGIGEANSESKFKIVGLEISTSRVGPGVLFALFGLVLIIIGLSKLPAARETRAETERKAADSPPAATTAPATATATAVGPAANPDASAARPAAPSPSRATLVAEVETPSPPIPANTCRPGYVWRVARPEDLVCVPPQARERTAEENRLAASRTDPAAGYGPRGCAAGFVWREAFDGDTVCVTPGVRDTVADENRLAAGRRAP